MNGPAPGQVADHHHRAVIHFVGHDVQVAVSVQIKNHGGTGAERAFDRHLACKSTAQRMVLVFPGAIQNEVVLVDASSRARLDTQQKLRIEEPLARFVQQHGIDAVAKRIAHAGGDKNVLITVGVEVGHTHTPRPIGFDTELVGHFVEGAVAFVLVEGIAENIV